MVSGAPMSMTTRSSRAALDTNIFVYSYDDDSPWQAECRALVTDRRRDFAVPLQVLVEFYAVMTKTGPNAHIQKPIGPDTALRIIRRFCSRPNVQVLPASGAIYDRWHRLAKARAVRGRRVFDLMIAAALIEGGVGLLYTYNTRDFKRIDGLEARRPDVR